MFKTKRSYMHLFILMSILLIGAFGAISYSQKVSGTIGIISGSKGTWKTSDNSVSGTWGSSNSGASGTFVSSDSSLTGVFSQSSNSGTWSLENKKLYGRLRISGSTGTFDTIVSDVDSEGKCGFGMYLGRLSDGNGGYLKRCFDGSIFTYDCEYYDLSLACQCGSDSDVQQMAQGSIKGCVPIVQQVFNSMGYKRLSANNYEYAKCPEGYTKIVSVSTQKGDNNPTKIPKACASTQQIRGCSSYKISSTKGTSSDGVTKANQIICTSCFAGFKAYSTAGNAFTYRTVTTSLACPRDGSYDSNCVKLKLDTNNQYECECGSTNFIKYTSTISQPVAIGCLDSAAPGSQYDAACAYYHYSPTLAQVVCDRCNTGKTLSILQNSLANGPDLHKCYANDKKIEGCTLYVIGSDSSLLCLSCDSEHDLLNYDDAAPALGSTKTAGTCVPKGRWIIEPSICAQYSSPSFTTDTYLTCYKCQTTNDGTAPSCYKNTPAKTGSCSNGQLQKKDANGANKCLITKIIDNCLVYTAVTTNAGAGCKQCDAGYTLVDTDNSNTNNDATLKICIPNEKVDSNCNYYSNADFTCASCSNGLKYDKNLKKCQLPTDASSACLKAINSGSTLICINCRSGYATMNGVCVKTVPFCTSQSSDATCLACVNNYQLISNQCIQIPNNCLKVNASGQCLICKPNYELNGQNICFSSIKNICPAGQIIQNGQCTPVQQLIDNCYTYTTDGKCDQCYQGYIPSLDQTQCVLTAITNSKASGIPCPPNTSRLSYRRNPSDPMGECVGVDVQCVNARDDGFCISCKKGEYSYNGLCYKIIF